MAYINNYYLLTITGPLLLLYPCSWFRHLTLFLTTVCLCHFLLLLFWLRQTVVIALHVIPLFLCLWQEPFTCSVLFCRCEDLLYGCIISVCHPLISNRIKRAIVYYTFLCCNPQFASLRYFLPHVVTHSHVVLSPCLCFYHAARHIIIAPGYSSSHVIIIPSCDAIFTQFVIYWAPCPCYFHTSPSLPCPYTCLLFQYRCPTSSQFVTVSSMLLS